MAAITLSVPNELKYKMDKTDWINWSSVARHAFADALDDVDALKKMKKIREISEIADSDKREVRESIAKEVINSIEKSAEKIRSGKSKPMTSEEFKKWCGSL
ncbi:MAG: hypothetical protein ABIA76_01230 [Candidatus Diapherotrites archaeon]